MDIFVYMYNFISVLAWQYYTCNLSKYINGTITVTWYVSAITKQIINDFTFHLPYIMFWRDDYDKKIEECKMLHERLSDISDKFTQLKQTSTTEIKDLDSKLQEADRKSVV